MVQANISKCTNKPGPPGPLEQEIGYRGGTTMMIQRKRSNETLASTLCIDLFETLGFRSLVDDTERREEETYYNCHEAVDSRECVVQRVVCKRCDWCYTKASGRGVVVGDRNKGLVGAEGPSDFSRITCIKIPTALELILEDDAVCYTQLEKRCMEIVSFLKSEKPDPRADEQDDYSIDNKFPVEDNQAHSDVVGLDYSTNRYYNSGEEKYSQNKASCQRGWAEHHVHQNVRGTPYNG